MRKATCVSLIPCLPLHYLLIDFSLSFTFLLLIYMCVLITFIAYAVAASILSLSKEDMVFFSTYRSSRLVAPNFFREQVLRMRAFGDYYFQRSWNGSLMWVIPGDMRLWATIIPMIYFIHRWHTDHSLDADGVEKALILRWGGSLEALRKNLSAEDQLRARSTCDLEKLFSAYGPKDLLIQPAGDPLPGKNYYNNAHAH